MKKLIADMHMHTLVSGHAYGTIREMAATAGEKNLKLIGITEHAPGIPGTVDPFYYLNLTVIPRVLSNVQILHGCEINVLNGGKLSLEQKYIDFLDYAIVGIHKECYTDEGKEKNTDNLIACMKMRKYILSLTRMMIIHHLTMNVSFQLPNSTGSLWKSTTVRWSKKTAV